MRAPLAVVLSGTYWPTLQCIRSNFNLSVQVTGSSSQRSTITKPSHIALLCPGSSNTMTTAVKTKWLIICCYFLMKPKQNSEQCCCWLQFRVCLFQQLPPKWWQKDWIQVYLSKFRSLIMTAGFIYFYLFIYLVLLSLCSRENCPKYFVVLCFSTSSPPLLRFFLFSPTPQIFWNSTWWLHKQKRGFPHLKEKPAMKAAVKVKSVGTFQSKTGDLLSPTPQKVEVLAKWVEMSPFGVKKLSEGSGGMKGWIQSWSKNCH